MFLFNTEEASLPSASRLKNFVIFKSFSLQEKLRICFPTLKSSLISLKSHVVCKGNQFVKLKLLPIFKTNVFELYVHRQVKTVLQIVKR